MKILVSLSSYGSKNLHFLDRVVNEYKSYSKYEVSVIVHCTDTLPRADISQIIHKDPLTTSLFHRQDFIRERNNYDLFLFGEYDMLIKESAIDTYVKYNSILPLDYCLGFIRYENAFNSTEHLIDLWLNIPGYTYLETKDLTIENNKFFKVSNVHQACYLLTKEKLNYVINNSEYDFTDLNGLGVESASSGIFSTWPLGPRGVMHKVLPQNREDLLNCFIHHTPNVHCTGQGVNTPPEIFCQNTVTKEQLLSDLNL